MGKKIKRIGILTQRRQPGLNAAIRASAKRRSTTHGDHRLSRRLPRPRGKPALKLDKSTLPAFSPWAHHSRTSRDKPHRMVIDGRTAT